MDELIDEKARLTEDELFDNSRGQSNKRQVVRLPYRRYEDPEIRALIERAEEGRSFD